MALDVVKGIVLLEGSFPIDHLHPALKHLLHYGKQTERAGLLDWFSMFCFERNNKDVKSRARSTSNPLSSVANHTELDIIAKLHSFSEKTPDDLRVQHIVLSVNINRYVLSDREKMVCPCWEFLHFVNSKHTELLQFWEFISEVGSGDNTGVGL